MAMLGVVDRTGRSARTDRVGSGTEELKEEGKGEVREVRSTRTPQGPEAASCIQGASWGKQQ